MGLLQAMRADGREPGRRVLAVRGAVFLLATAVVVGLLFLYGRGTFSGAAVATVAVDDAGGSLVEGSDVKYDGVVVGRVRDLRAGGGGVEVQITVPRQMAADLPGNLRARILPATIFGTSFVDLVADGEPAGGFRSGQAIAQDRSRGTLEIQAILDDLDRVVDALGPAELSGALEGLAGALDGNGEQLGRTVEQIEGYLRRLNPSMELVRENLDLLASNLEAFERYAPDLFRATEDVLVAARTLAEGEEDFRGLTRQGTRTLSATDELVRENRTSLIESLLQTAVVVDVLYDGREDVVEGLLETFRLARGFRDALDHGPWARIHAQLVRSFGPAYGPEDCPSYGGHRGRGCR